MEQAETLWDKEVQIGEKDDREFGNTPLKSPE